jgi:lysophospholipase L1-like esterase
VTTPKDYVTGYTQRGKLPELQNMILRKCYKPRRRIDLLMVSVGGNDVGFSRLVANAVLADKALLKKIGGWVGSVQDVSEARWRLDVLKTRYRALNKAFHYMLRIPWPEADRIILTAYPYMARREDGVSMCPKGNAGMDLYHDFGVMPGKLKKASQFADELYQVMKRSAVRYGWSFVDEHREKFAPHGFCAVNSLKNGQADEILALPRFQNGEWWPYNPSLYHPYASRQRWIRTPNDGYMTVNFHADDLISRQLMNYKRSKWFQIVMAGTYSGSFHPTAEGHAAIADSVVKKARLVLKKYEK